MNDTLSDILKLVLIKGPLLAVCLGSIGLISNDNLSKNEFDELVLVLNYIMLFHGLTSDFALSILDTRKAISHLKRIKNIVQNNTQYPSETISANNVMNPLRISPAPAAPVVEFRNVSLIIKNTTILSNISFKIMGSSSCALVGQSGSGKSSIIKLLCGFYKPTTGTVFINGTDINTISKNHLRELIAMVNQDTQLFYSDIKPSKQTLKYNVLFSQANSNRLDQLRHGAHLTAAEKGLFTTAKSNFFLNNTPDHISKPSGGEQQRVGIARALAMEPQVLLMDEPFGALDALTRAKLPDELLAIVANTQSTVVMVTHDVDEAVLLSDKIVMMTNGPAATIGEVLHVDLPRPRSRVTLADDPAYLHDRKAVIDFLYTRQAHVEKH